MWLRSFNQIWREIHYYKLTPHPISAQEDYIIFTQTVFVLDIRD